MQIARVWAPLATRPPNALSAAAFSSVWNGSGSQSVAKVLISSAVTG